VQKHLNFSSDCEFYPKCGGCALLHLENQEYQNFKKENLKKELDLQYQWVWIKPNSRRKITLQITNNNDLGFFIAKSNKIIPINKCFIVNDEISKLLPLLQKLIKKLKSKKYNSATITSFDNIIDIVLDAKDDPDFVENDKLINFAKEQKINISYKINNHISPIIKLEPNQIFYDDFKINLSSNIFIQATKEGLIEITKIIKEFLPKNSNKIADIFSGFGAYSFAISNYAKEIHAYEKEEEMIALINQNSATNNLSNKLKAHTRDLFSSPLTAKELNEFDTIIINPPRIGALKQINEVLKSDLKHIIYISCNPNTFKRDYTILNKHGFKVLKSFAIDQFYGSKHLELVTILTKHD